MAHGRAQGGAQWRGGTALQHGIACGMTLIDTAEMYGSGGARTGRRRGDRGQRDRVYLVSKVLPSNAGRKRMKRACERSLKRLGTDYLDLYLLHWRSGVSLDEIVEGFLALKEDGKIRRFGVSNFDVDDMEELWKAPGGQGCQTTRFSTTSSAAGPRHRCCRGPGATASRS